MMQQPILIEMDQIDAIRPLWEQLNRLHLSKSPHFKEFYRSFTFEDRIGTFLKMNPSDLRIELFKEGDRAVAYCLSSIEGEKGEIESLYVDDAHRNGGRGGLLVEHALEWFDKRSCKTVSVSVAAGHESAFGFYERFGFYPRLTRLQRMQGGGTHFHENRQI